MEGSASTGPGAERSLCIGVLLVALLVMTVAHLSTNHVPPAGGLAQQQEPLRAGVVWVVDPPSLIGDHVAPRQEAAAPSASDEPGERSLIAGAVALLAACWPSLRRRAGRRRLGAGRRCPLGIAVPVLRPG